MREQGRDVQNPNKQRRKRPYEWKNDLRVCITTTIGRISHKKENHAECMLESRTKGRVKTEMLRIEGQCRRRQDLWKNNGKET